MSADVKLGFDVVLRIHVHAVDEYEAEDIVAKAFSQLPDGTTPYDVDATLDNNEWCTQNTLPEAKIVSEKKV